jgi:hypothetical protein
VVLPAIGEAIHHCGTFKRSDHISDLLQHVTIRMKLTSVEQTCLSPALLGSMFAMC